MLFLRVENAIMPTSIKLSKIIKIDLRDCWKKEATNFTPWLASEENITLLADATLGVKHDWRRLDGQKSLFNRIFPEPQCFLFLKARGNLCLVLGIHGKVHRVL